VVYPPDLLDRLQAVQPCAWTGTVYRHMFGSYQPDQQNTRGARWNPPNTAAIYTCLTHDGAVAEGDHAIALQPVRPKAARSVYEVRVGLANALDLTDRATLETLGIGEDELAGIDMAACQELGGAVAWLEHDGLLVPSARSVATNLVIYPTNQEPDAVFEVVRANPIA
jgi:RES domain-containing protein